MYTRVEEVARHVGLLGCSQMRRHLLLKLCKVARTDVEVLISGPSGVGKELYARFVHECSDRSKHDFVPFNCGAVPEGLFENEMFGHAAGAYTGARTSAEGLAATSGTLFLDEVSELPKSAQVTLLRFIQEREFRRLGETRLRRARFRIITATNADLMERVREGRFREDLFFRLGVVMVDVPPLCQRPDDLAALLGEFVARYAEQYALEPVQFDGDARGRLLTYHWPGNVRELENCVRSLTCQQLGRPVKPGDLQLLGCEAEQRLNYDCLQQRFQRAKQEVVTSFERQYVQAALRRCSGNIAEAARLSGKHRRAFFELMRKHGIDAGEFKGNGDSRPVPSARGSSGSPTSDTSDGAAAAP